MNCPNLLVLKPGAPKKLSIPYLAGGTDLIKSSYDFFDVTPISSYSYTCNFGDTCGEATINSSPYVSQTSVMPFQISYSQSNQNGYATTNTFCIYCRVIETDNFFLTHVFKIT